MHHFCIEHRKNVNKTQKVSTALHDSVFVQLYQVLLCTCNSCSLAQNEHLEAKLSPILQLDSSEMIIFGNFYDLDK